MIVAFSGKRFKVNCLRNNLVFFSKWHFPCECLRTSDVMTGTTPVTFVPFLRNRRRGHRRAGRPSRYGETCETHDDDDDDAKRSISRPAELPSGRPRLRHAFSRQFRIQSIYPVNPGVHPCSTYLAVVSAPLVHRNYAVPGSRPPRLIPLGGPCSSIVRDGRDGINAHPRARARALTLEREDVSKGESERKAQIE